MEESHPKTLGRYEIRRELGRGTMGVVYEAQDPMLHRRVALKAIRLAFAIPTHAREHYEKRFLAEARAAAALSHPGIVVVHDAGQDEKTGTLYIALEFLEGQTLDEVTARGGRLEMREALSTVARVAQALHHAHERGIVHRDIKPANIMRLPSGQAKIMDFGIARLPASQLTSAGDFFGTPSYMSPEQAAGEAADARSDIFSLGCVLYELLTGRRAFDGDTLPAILMRVREENPRPPSRWVEGLAPEVDAVVGRALAKSRDARYPDARSLAEDLEDVLAGRTPRHSDLLPLLEEGEATLVSRPAAPAATPPTPAPPAIPPAKAPGSSVTSAASARARQRTLGMAIAAVGLLAAGFLAALVVPWRGQPVVPLPTLAPLVPPAHLEIALEHPFRSGSLSVWIDDELALEETFQGRVTRQLLSLRTYKGTLSRSIDVPPGEHVVRVQVEAGDFRESLRIRGTFESGVSRRLVAEVGGLIKKELKLVWGS